MTVLAKLTGQNSLTFSKPTSLNKSDLATNPKLVLLQPFRANEVTIGTRRGPQTGDFLICVQLEEGPRFWTDFATAGCWLSV